MRVSKCSENKAMPPIPTISWDEMVKKEGVYRIDDDAGETRFIVLKEMNSEDVVLYFSYSNLEPANKSAWVAENRRYVRTNETVCFELKPA